MSLNDFEDEEVKQSLEYSCKQWCGNHSVKYNVDNIKCPVSQEEHAGVIASKAEGFVFSFDYQGKRVYGYYQAAKPQAAANSNTPTSGNVQEPVRPMDNALKDSGKQLPVVGTNGYEDNLEQLFEKIDQKFMALRVDIIVLDNMFDEVKERIHAQAQALTNKPKGKRSAKRQRRSGSVSGVPDKEGKHENSKSRKLNKKPSGLLLRDSGQSGSDRDGGVGDKSYSTSHLGRAESV